MKHTIVFLAVLFSLSSCNSEKEKMEEIKEVQETEVLSTWTLIKFEPGFSPIKNYDEGLILWTFRENQELNVSIDEEVDSNPIKSTGKYTFSISEGKITIDNLEFDYNIENDTLIISDNPAADGFRATFVKIPANY